MSHTKESLNDFSGEAREGEIMAVLIALSKRIMAVLGVSGSGKSTLIDALADRIARQSLHALNGEVLESKFLKMISAYVMRFFFDEVMISSIKQKASKTCSNTKT
ncbi:hypothetical protein RND71_040639 [Anisodus tanguticus]|uniref:Uncharacterized protein n=1 Tax=Anisodus tanguticus TaxID=243964 RepID=A0AAE1QVY6_9SOLA|nr:hypothetical protein RND71_040639 [Anisodus tanguticus]